MPGNKPIQKRQSTPLSFEVDTSTVNQWGPETRESKKPCSAKGSFHLEYPFFRTHLFRNKPLNFDHSQIPIETDPLDKSLYYNPGLIASYGLYQVSRFIEEGEIPARYEAMRMADWLVECLSEWRQHFYAWPQEHGFSFYRIKSPWLSAQSHGLALSLLLRIAYLNNDAWYEDAAMKIIRLYFLPVEEGGLMRKLPSGDIAFEEYPVSGRSLPLSGQLLSLIGLGEYAHYFDDHNVQTVLQSGLRGLRENLPKYDLGKWLLFDLHPSRRCASPDEIKKNCTLLKILSQLMDEHNFAEIAQKWSAYTDAPASKRYYFFQRLWEAIRLRVSASKYSIDTKYLKVAPR